MGPTLLQDFEAKVALDPDFPVVEQGDLAWSRRDLRDLTEALDSQLPPAPEGALVALRAKNGPVLLACLLLGRRRGWTTLLVDGETPDPQLERTVRAFGLDGAIDVVVPCATLSSADPAVHWIAGDHDASARSWDPELEATPAFVKLTSGSTGHPNAVVVSEAQVLADESALFATMELGPERVLTTIPMAHSYGFSSVAVAALRRDFTLVLPESANPLSAIRCLRHRAISFLPSVPAWLKAVTELPAAPDRLGGVRTVISAGAPLPSDVAVAFQDRFGLPIHNFYGASECGGICYDRDGSAGLSGALGHPVEGVEMVLISEDGESVEPVPAGNDSVGRVCVHSESVAMGRLAMLDGTKDAPTYRRLLDDDSLGQGRFLTMDLGRLGEAGLQIVGRADDLLNLRGRKVHPREIETVLDSHPQVQESYVFQTGSSGSPVLTAVVVGADELSRAEVLQWARIQLPDFKVPRAVVRLPALARNARGKLDRRRLEDEALKALQAQRERAEP